MNKNQFGGGSWTSYCPICGIHFRITVDKDLEGLIEYHSKPGSKNKRLWKENKDKIINNFNKFKKIEKYTFSNYNKITLLLPNSIVKHGVKYDDSNDFSSKSKKYGEVYFDYPLYDDDGTKGLPVHTECWNLAKNKLKHELKFEDFLFNKYISKTLGYYYYLFNSIKYGPPLKYLEQDWDFNLWKVDSDAFLLNEKDWYSLYLPSGKTMEAQKNSKRIITILEKIIKGIKESKVVTKKLNTDRPSPAESATLFEVGKKKKGNDGNMYEVVEDKNKVKKWKIFKKDRPSPSESATKFKVGTKKKGNDGNMYIIVSDKNNVNRWKKI